LFGVSLAARQSLRNADSVTRHAGFSVYRPRLLGDTMASSQLCQRDIVESGWSVPNEAEYLIELDAEVARIRVRFSSDRAMVIEFLVQLEAVHDRQFMIDSGSLCVGPMTIMGVHTLTFSIEGVGSIARNGWISTRIRR
jgi:hypothetical protein